MRDANAFGRLQLKSKLLVGVAGLAAASGTAAYASDATPPATDPPKWAPYADIGAGVGDGFTESRATLFAPVWQDIDSLLFVRLGVGTATHDNEIFNLGVGYRTKISPDWILGLFGGFDNTHTVLSHNFGQVSLGAELMSTDWDVRLNAYSARNKPQTVADRFELYIHDTQIAVLQAQEAALSGFDGEVGYRVFHTDTTDVRLYAGGFIFQNDHHVKTPGIGQEFDFLYPKMSGPRGRVEVNMFDLDLLGAQSRLSLDGEVSHDKVRGTSGFVGATLRIPLGVVSGGAQMLDDLDRRMADPVRRSDNVLASWQFNKPEPVIIYNGAVTSQPTNTLYYVAGSTAGEGSYADPTTLNDATARGPVNQFIVVTDRDGQVKASNAVVQTGETVVGGGEAFKVRGVQSGRVFDHTFAPGSGTPTIVPENPGDNILVMQSGSVVHGLNFGGDFNAAIYGHNVDQIDISDVTIDGTGGGQYGVLINEDMSGDLHLNLSDSTINGVGTDGVAIHSTASDGGTGNQVVSISNTTITGSGHDGVNVSTDVTGGSTLGINVGIHDSTIGGSGNADVYMIGTAGPGSTLNQSLVVDPTTLSSADYAIFVGAYSDGGTLTQNVSISDVTISGVTMGGIYVYAYGVDGALVNQTVNMSGVTVSGNFSNGEKSAPKAEGVSVGGHAYGSLITIGAIAQDGAEVDQNFHLSNITANGAYYDDLLIEAYAGSDGVTHQYGTADTLSANNSLYGNGIDVVAYAANGGTVMQRAAFSHVTADGNRYDGAGVFSIANSAAPSDALAQDGASNPTIAAQYVQFSHFTATGNYDGFDGLTLGIGSTATTLQQLSLDHATLENNIYGASIWASATASASVQQILSLTHSTIDGNSESGVSATASAFFEGFAAQSLYMDHDTVTNNLGDGIDLTALGIAGGDVEQSAYIYHSAVTYNGRDGMHIQTLAAGYDFGFEQGYYYYGHISQNVIAAYDAFSRNARDGVYVANTIEYGGGLNQFLYFYGDNINHNGRNGVYEDTTAESTLPGGILALPTEAYADLYVVASNTYANAAIGIAVKSFAYTPLVHYLIGPLYLIQHVDVYDTHANNNGVGGFADVAYDVGFFTDNIQYVSLANSTFDHNGHFGAAVAGYQYFGPYSFGAVIQEVSISGSDFSHNGGDGLIGVASASGFQGRVAQYFNISGSTFDHNTGDGISLYRHAYNGVYYAFNYNENTYGYPCNKVQGIIGGCAIVRQTATILNSDISYNGGDGIYLKTVADNYGTVYTGVGRPQEPTLVIGYSNINNNHGDGLDVVNDVGQGSYLYQYILGVGSHFDNNHGDGIFIGNHVHDGGIVAQNRLASYTNNYGTYYYYNLYPGSKLTLYASTASGNHGDGIGLFNDVENGSLLYQYVRIINSHIDNNHGYGINAQNYVSGGSQLLQNILIYTYAPSSSASAQSDSIPMTVDNNGLGGINIATYSNGGYSENSAAINALTLLGVDVSGNAGNGVYMGMVSAGTYLAAQVFYSAGNRFAGNDGFGVGVLDIGGGDFYNIQVAISTHDLFAYNGEAGFGAGLVDFGSYSAHQILVSASDAFLGNQHGGLVQYAGFVGTREGTQNSLIEYSYFAANGTAYEPAASASYVNTRFDNGIYVGMNATGEYTTALSNQIIIGNTVLGSGADGIHVEIGSGFGAHVYDYTVIAGNDVEYSGGNGIYVSLNAYDGGHILSSNAVGYGAGILIAENTVKNSGTGAYGGDGIHVSLNAGAYGLISGYAGDAAYSSAVKYSNLSPFTTSIEGNTVDGAAGNGIYLGTNNDDGRIVAETSIGYYAPNTVSNVDGYGVAVHNQIAYGITLALAAVYNNTISNAATAGIGVTNYNSNGFMITVEHITGNSISGASYVGIGVANGDFGGTFQNRAVIDHNTIRDAYIGIGIADAFYSEPNPVYSPGLSDGVTLSYNAIYDLHLGIGLIDSGASQGSGIKSNTIFGDETSYGIAAAVYNGGTQVIYCEQLFTKYPLNSMVGIPPSQQYEFHNYGGTQIIL